MLPSKANWKYINNYSAEEGNDLDLHLSPIVKDLFLERGITTIEEANQFLHPDLEDLINPFLLQGMEASVERIKRAIENKEKILVYGDYDADGVSSTIVLLHALHTLGADCEYYIPNRFTEGYGPNETAFRELHQAGFQLIITVDTGIASVHEAAVAKELGMDLIITDHHEPQPVLPDCYAIIHPKLSESYPFKELAGVGVSFKLAEALLGRLPKEMLAFAAIGTIADLVPLLSENRILATYGLRELQCTAHIGLRALKQVCQIDDVVSAEDVGFRIGPRLNAVGRLGSADLAVDLLLEDNEEIALEMANELNQMNEQRKKIVQAILAEANKMVQTDKRIIVVAKEGWNEGVLGIVASHLVRMHDRPAIVLSIKQDKGIVKGSARSIPAFDLFEGCMKARDLFAHFGGHAQAAGMTLPMENVKQLESALDDILYKELTEEDFKQELKISRKLNIEEIHIPVIEEIASLAPFGMGNPSPLFELNEVPADVRQIGSKKNHLKMQFRSQAGQLDAIGFGLGELAEAISPNTKVTLAGELSINEWNGRRNPQFKIEDVKITEWQLFDYRGKRAEKVLPNDTKAVFVSSEYLKTMESATFYTYQEALAADLASCHTVGFTELPDNLETIQKIVQRVQPENIIIAIRQPLNQYPFQIPSRKEFVEYYGLIQNHKQFVIRQMQQAIEQHRGWNEAKVKFMSEVFADLDFVSIENGYLQYQEVAVKKDLSESTLYQTCMQQKEAERVLMFSNYQDLKQWFEPFVRVQTNAKEEVISGF